MAILKKPESKKCNGLPARTSASGLSMLMGAGRTMDLDPLRREMNKVQLATMKADLRKHIAEAEMAELSARQFKIAMNRPVVKRAEETNSPESCRNVCLDNWIHFPAR